MAILTRAEHFAKLNTFPRIPGEEWEIEAETYFHFLEVLPPIYGKGCFWMSEFFSGPYTQRYRVEDGRYYSCLVDFREDCDDPDLMAQVRAHVGRW